MGAAQSISKASTPLPLQNKTVPIDATCTGDWWSVQDENQLARLVAIIAMGQAAYAAHILKRLVPAAPAFADDDLRREAKIRLTIQEDGKKPRTGYPQWQRDGFIFEAISWIAARQTYGETALLKDPHVSATSQGLDGLMIKLAADKSKIVMTTVFEDKCTDDPRATFTGKVIPALLERHRNKRSAELVASASVLLRMAGIEDGAAAELSAAVLDRNQRSYRAAFALTKEYDDQDARKKLFAGYDAVDNIPQGHRIGATFIVSGKLREWFKGFSALAISYLDQIEIKGA